MEDFHLSTIASIFLAVILMFFIPTLVFVERMDSMIQNYVTYRTENFSDSVRSRGVITWDAYEEFAGYIYSTGYGYEIEIEHEKRVVMPVYGEDGTFLNDYTEHYEVAGMEEIKEALIANGEYKINFGDMITVRVTSREDMLSTTMIGALLGGAGQEPVQYITGGMIWNEAY